MLLDGVVFFKRRPLKCLYNVCNSYVASSSMTSSVSDISFFACEPCKTKRQLGYIQSAASSINSFIARCDIKTTIGYNLFISKQMAVFNEFALQNMSHCLYKLIQIANDCHVKYLHQPEETNVICINIISLLWYKYEISCDINMGVRDFRAGTHQEL